MSNHPETSVLRDTKMLQRYLPKEAKLKSRMIQVRVLSLFSFYELTSCLTVDSDDDIVMPEGPPPGLEEEPVDSDDDIPMPEGPPPGKGQGVCDPYRS